MMLKNEIKWKIFSTPKLRSSGIKTIWMVFFFQNQPWDILLMLLLPSDCHSMLPFSSRCLLTIPQFSVITHFQRCNNFIETKNFHDLKINALLDMQGIVCMLHVQIVIWMATWRQKINGNLFFILSTLSTMLLIYWNNYWYGTCTCAFVI